MSNQIIHLHNFITERYTLDELKILSFNLGIEFEELPGWSTRSAKVREFLLVIGQEEKFGTLLEQLEKDRPIPFKQSGLSTDSTLVERLNDDLDDYRDISKPFLQKWQEQLQLNTQRVLILSFLIIIFLVAGFTALYFTLRPNRPKEMIGEFNIAIAEFGEIDEQGHVRSSDAGTDLSAKIFTRVEKEMEELPADLVVDVWHNVIEPGVRLDYLPGDTREERAQAAANLAEKINAHVIVYGNLKQREQGSEFLPEFYVTDLTDAAELVGAHTLGSEIPIQGTLDSLGGSIAFNEEFSARANALTLFVIGLAYEILGQPDKALEKFQQAEEIEGWDDNEGKEVLYLFIGREANTLWQRGEDRGDQTLAAMQKALDLNPGYGRAYIGIGNYHRELAQRQYEIARKLRYDQGEMIESESMLRASSIFNQEANQAVRYYHQALDNLPETDRDLVETKIHLALGSTHNRQAGFLLLVNNFETAEGFLDLALSENSMADSMAQQDDYRHRALAQLGIALAYHQQAHIRQVVNDPEGSEIIYEKALASYKSCIELAQEDEFDWFLNEFKEAQCKPGQRAVEDALAILKGDGS